MYIENLFIKLYFLKRKSKKKIFYESRRYHKISLVLFKEIGFLLLLAATVSMNGFRFTFY